MKIDIGCFGLPSVFNPTSRACSECKVRDRCFGTVNRVAQSLTEIAKIKVVVPKLEAAYVQPIPADLSAVPKKLQGRVVRMLDAGLHKTAAFMLRGGQNPFPLAKAKELHWAGELLVKHGGFTVGRLRDLLESRQGWSYQIAASQTSNAIAMLKALGLVSREQDRITLNV